MNKQLNKSKYLYNVIVILLCCINLFIIYTGESFSRYATSENNEGEAKVSLMANSVYLDISLVDDLYPGKYVIIPLSIDNKKDGTICEVAQSYKCTIQNLTKNLPLEIKTYSDKQCITEVKIEGQLKANEIETHNYWIKINWNEKDNSSAYSFEVDAIRLNFSAEQVD